jgi:hypothetical protein
MTSPSIDPDDRPPTEEEMRAAYEAEIKRLRVDDLLMQTVVSLVNLGARKAGLIPGAEDERDLEQLRQAIEGTRALLPLVEPVLGPDAKSVRDALSQLQLAFARTQEGVPGAAPAAPPAPDPPVPGDGPAQSSGRLWIPGQ